jgi:formamidopyrimidine-DNA glycosylase
MPELPEVETIVRRLRDGTTDSPPLPGQTIRSVDILWNRIVQTPESGIFQQALPGRRILAVNRRGKYLHFPLSNGHLIGHLRMSGDMHLEPGVDKDGLPLPATPFTQAQFNLDSPWRLLFKSVRKFGRLWLVDDPQSVLGVLGPEPLGADLDPDILYQMLQRHHRQMKPLLLDQTFIAGLGNIYTDESLFKAKIHPRRASDTLSRADAEMLYYTIREVLEMGIEHFGASLDWIYRGGEFQNHFSIHRRKGEPCLVCGATIEKITVGQRGTYYCPHCQTIKP